MALDNLQPFAGEHAIQSAALALDFSAELDVGEVMRLRDAHADLRQDFPNLLDQQRTRFQLTPGQGHGEATSDVGGFIMERPSSAPLVGGLGALRAIIVSRDSALFVINDYTRWERFRADVERYMDLLLKSINAQKAIASIGLQITDAFVWKADPADLNLDEVFKHDTPLLPKNIHALGSHLWHSHHGFIVDPEGSLKYQRLDNVNVSRSIVAGNHQIQILTSHKATFPRPVYKFLDASRDKVFSVLEDLHLTNKRILASLLSDQLQEKIKLNYKAG